MILLCAQMRPLLEAQPSECREFLGFLEAQPQPPPDHREQLIFYAIKRFSDITSSPHHLFELMLMAALILASFGQRTWIY